MGSQHYSYRPLFACTWLGMGSGPEALSWQIRCTRESIKHGNLITVYGPTQVHMRALHPQLLTQNGGRRFSKSGPKPGAPALVTLFHWYFCIADVNIILGNNMFQVNSLSGLHAHTNSDRQIKKRNIYLRDLKAVSIWICF